MLGTAHDIVFNVEDFNVFQLVVVVVVVVVCVLSVFAIYYCTVLLFFSIMHIAVLGYSLSKAGLIWSTSLALPQVSLILFLFSFLEITH